MSTTKQNKKHYQTLVTDRTKSLSKTLESARAKPALTHCHRHQWVSQQKHCQRHQPVSKWNNCKCKLWGEKTKTGQRWKLPNSTADPTNSSHTTHPLRGSVDKLYNRPPLPIQAIAFCLQSAQNQSGWVCHSPASTGSKTDNKTALVANLQRLFWVVGSGSLSSKLFHSNVVWLFSVLMMPDRLVSWCYVFELTDFTQYLLQMLQHPLVNSSKVEVWCKTAGVRERDESCHTRVYSRAKERPWTLTTTAG